MELGLYSFADVGPEINPAQRLCNLLEEIELADQVGLDVFGVASTTALTTPSRRRPLYSPRPQSARKISA
jgi:hypothetical protein